MLVIVVVALISLLVGLLHLNSMRYLLGDTYSLLIVPGIYIASWHILKKENLERVFKNLITILTLLSIAYLPIQFYFLIIRRSVHLFSTMTYFFPILYLLAKPKKLRWTEKILLPMFILGTILTFKRGLWIITFIGIVLICITSRNWKRMKQAIAQITIGIVIAFSIIFFFSYSQNLKKKLRKAFECLWF